MTLPQVAKLWLSVAVVLCAVSMAWAAEKRPIEVIQDDSFLIEEAYNQEPNVIQHIFTAAYNNDSRQRGWTFNFTQEWPVFSQDHQFSYSVPTYHFIDGSDRIYGVGDILINYRYQALYEDDSKPAFAPRFSLILPTGSRRRGTGDNVVGYQWNLPFSKKLGSRFAAPRQLRLDLFASRTRVARWPHAAIVGAALAGFLQRRRQRDLCAVSALSFDAGVGRRL